MTVEAYAAATPRQRLAYRFSRHPLNISLAYVTIFLYGMCFRSLVAQPRMHLDSAVSIAVHAAVVTVTALLGGVDAMLLVVMLPCAVASAIGAYFFYAQHNYPTVKLRKRSEWDYNFAALESSSFIQMNRLMHWFTGNIGYHHVHHLNFMIPFYRLPEAMAAIPELQNPGLTSLSPRDILACIRLKLWDPQQDRMITFKELASLKAEPSTTESFTAPALSSD
jgi:omega-6 fatty acid desaturase (delta-12 desaturase)